MSNGTERDDVMAKTELHKFAMEHGWTELQKEIEKFDTARLFAELDDTIQFDILGISNDEWTLHMRSEKVVYNAICRELLKRCGNEQ